VPKPRRPLKFWGYAAIVGVFTLCGLLLLVVGPDAETRLTGLVSILFFGLGGLAFLGGPLLTRRGPGTVRAERVSTSAGLEPAFVFPTPAAKRWAMTVGAGGMAAAGVLMVFLGAGWIGILAAAVFGLFFVFMLWTARRPQRLVLTPTRIMADAGAGTVELPWEAVEDVELFELPAGRTTVDMLGVSATDPGAAVWTRGALLGRMSRNMTAYDLCVGADTFAGSGEDVVEAIRRYRDDPAGRRRIGAEGELGDLHRLLSLAGRT
jgi:hypothetical protein